MNPQKRRPALSTPTTKPETLEPAESSKQTAGSSTSAPRPRWWPLADLQRATLPQDGRPEMSEAHGIPPGEKLADQAAECRAWGDRERAS